MFLKTKKIFIYAASSDVFLFWGHESIEAVLDIFMNYLLRRKLFRVLKIGSHWVRGLMNRLDEAEACSSVRSISAGFDMRQAAGHYHET